MCTRLAGVMGVVVLSAVALPLDAAAPIARPATRPAGVATTRPAAGPTPRPALSTAVPFAERAISGKLVTFPGDYRGKLVLVNVWASWCPYCRKEVDFWKDAYARYHDKGLEIIGVSTDKNRQTPPQQFLAFLGQNGVTWPQVYAAGPKLMRMYEVTRLPTSFLVDGTTGRVIAQGQALRGTALNKQIDGYLLKAGKPAATKPSP